MKRLSNQHCATTERRLILRVFNLILSYWILCGLKVDERKGIKEALMLSQRLIFNARAGGFCYHGNDRSFVSSYGQGLFA